MYNMQEIGIIILYSFASGAPIIIGGMLAPKGIESAYFTTGIKAD
jgi:hypothetical protein